MPPDDPPAPRLGLDRHKVIDRPEWRDRAAAQAAETPRGPEKPATVPLSYGRLTVHMQADCPDRARFEMVVKDQLDWYFQGDTQKAARGAEAFHAALIVPVQYRANPDVMRKVQSAQIDMSREAKAWVGFVSEIERDFSDQAEDGDRKEQAIPGWEPHEVRVTLDDGRHGLSGYDPDLAAVTKHEAGRDDDLGR